ncbi:ATP-binding protein [Kutzneria chonburiensis]|uniref:ATP-binding protein n=1 Tax=Kutzneria chonburiensis TaxID=1483604 RepID=UPI002362BCDB|nr:ATP-binding protein [Kutzneria chonburiensis]
MTSADSLIGRRAELGLLRRRLADARAGAGHLVLVTGPAGIGKTRLVEELVADGTPVGWGAAVTDVGMPALWPWVRAVRDLPGPRDAVNALVAGTAQREHSSAEESAAAIFAADTAVLDALASASGSVLVLDDLQWADEATLRLLDRVAAEIRRLPLLVVGVHRDGPDLRAHRAAEVVSLGPLSQSESACLLSTAVDGADAAAVRRAVEQSGGSPLYLRTLAKAAADTLRGNAADTAGSAPAFRHLVTAAMRAAGPEAAAAVEALSVLGPEPHVLAQLLDADPVETLERFLPAVPAGLVEIGPAGVRFAHVLVRDAAYAALSPSRRAALHRAAAELLEPLAIGRDDRAAAVARHWQQAGEPGNAGPWAIRAAEAARMAGAYEESASYVGMALDAGGSDQAELLLDLARVQYLAGHISQSAETCERAADEGSGPVALTSSAAPRSSCRASAIPRPTAGSKTCADGRSASSASPPCVPGWRRSWPACWSSSPGTTRPTRTRTVPSSWPPIRTPNWTRSGPGPAWRGRRSSTTRWWRWPGARSSSPSRPVARWTGCGRTSRCPTPPCTGPTWRRRCGRSPRCRRWPTAPACLSCAGTCSVGRRRWPR